MRLLRFLLTLAVLLLATCEATPEPIPTPVPTNTSVPPPTATPLPQRAHLLRVAILGEATTTNVWALFDEAGANYWNYVTQADYWPRLYYLTPPSLDLKSAAAKGGPSPLVCDSTTCTARVILRPELTWTDGSPLTADDVAFTINTALQFRLGLNWGTAYNPDILDYVEALNEATVVYHFKVKPSVADWYYGVLQGPILNQAYWEPRIVEAVKLLPDETLLPTIRELEIEFADMQSQVDKLNLSLNTMAPASTVYQDTSKQAQRLQEELISIHNKLEKNRTEYETKLGEARVSLFSLANANEPTLGAWKFASRVEGIFENQANLGTLFGEPWFEAVRYITYLDELAVVRALENNDVDIIITPDGLSANSVSRLENDSEITISRNITRSARFLAFNHANPYLADPALRQALACIIDMQMLAEELDGDISPMSGFVLEKFWRNEDISLPCARQSGDTRLKNAIMLLKTAGYFWREEPAVNSPGRDIKSPDGNDLPRLSILVSEEDALRVNAAVYIVQQAEILGLSLDVQQSDPDDLLYAVYGSGNYDLAILGWRLSAYPSYLCEWFMPSGENPFAYSGSSLMSECEAWSQTADLEQAKAYVSEIQSNLMGDLPLIPLYADVRYDAYRNMRYPFEDVIDGLSGLYGAPGLAIPIP